MCLTSRLVHQNPFHINSTISFHLTGVVPETVGTDVPDQVRSCKEQLCCGRKVLKGDDLVRLRKTVVEINGKDDKNDESGIGSNEEDDSDDDNNDDEEPLKTQPLTPQKRELEDQ